MKKQKVLTLADFTQGHEADVEDLFGIEFYNSLVNGEFGCAIQSTVSVVGRPRVLRRIEDRLTENPLPQDACFSHHCRPARCLSANVKSLAEHLGDEGVDRFETPLRAFNVLL